MEHVNYLPSNFNYNSPGATSDALKQSIVYKLMFIVGKHPEVADKHDWLNATLFAVRDRIVERQLNATTAQLDQDSRQVYYLSMEFLIGRTLSNVLISLNIYNEIAEALKELGLNIDDIVNEEDDPGLGNGGLGRLAACFLDSLTSLGLPGRGYGIRYDYGMFTQKIIDGQQVESPDNWLEYGNAWEFKRHHLRYKIKFGGRIQQEGNKTKWLDTEHILACAYDQLIPGYEINFTNTLRLWRAQTSKEINLGKFNQGNYLEAVAEKNSSENVSRVLYPNDSTDSGKELRLRQEYFLVSATIQDILRRHLKIHDTFTNLHEKAAIHLNDTHPVLAIPELIRILVDEHKMSFQDAWTITKQTFSYTNHTLMSEALETWPVDMLGRVLPRHLQIIFDINDVFLQAVRDRFPNDTDLLGRVSIIDEAHGRKVRMAWLAVIACHKINGVSALHSQLMVDSLFADFAKIYPERFCNKTNGVTPRRWIALANPSLSKVFDTHLKGNWRRDLSLLAGLNQFKNDENVLNALTESKLENKKRLANYIAEHLNTVVNPNCLFDVQIKRIHEYKRQLLNVLHVITRYNRIIQDPDAPIVPRVVIFAGKAASSYYVAKQIIHLINDVAQIINNDPRAFNKLKVVFIPNYSVSLAQIVIPAADLSEQISLAGTEASGTGNMKFALNGALTIGTLDGANVEMLENVGDENIFIFGNTAEQVEALRSKGYNPREFFDKDEELRQVLSQIANGTFSPFEPHRYMGLFDNLVNFGDYYQLLADYRSYIDMQDEVDKHYQNKDKWAQSVLSNIANMGYFSSDRTIQEYADDIWKIKPVNLA
ncbi:glycogen/starch/alpha-glucan family phosphorylase [Thorsellia anophelis]|uniref:Alpha-1,4 glucan phosphorylase n=1 Tax=Thorsellia anophelis DSM 18579 TaxID=1123402 RepID=A0A1I0CNA7_9GAMM|nr:glycogen/starch/alpha-glucan family phosphorylase [Thorsellia anophelis]SET21075.1 starch phosphorylase [Thorsellia anophelis DSM 18579]